MADVTTEVQKSTPASPLVLSSSLSHPSWYPRVHILWSLRALRLLSLHLHLHLHTFNETDWIDEDSGYFEVKVSLRQNCMTIGNCTNVDAGSSRYTSYYVLVLRGSAIFIHTHTSHHQATLTTHTSHIILLLTIRQNGPRKRRSRHNNNHPLLPPRPNSLRYLPTCQRCERRWLRDREWEY